MHKLDVFLLLCIFLDKMEVSQLILICVNVLLCNMPMYTAIRTVIKYAMNISMYMCYIQEYYI